MKRFGNVWYKILAVGIVLVILNKVLDNLSGFYGVFGKLIRLIRPFLVGGLLAFILYKPSHYLEEKLQAQKNSTVQKFARGLGIGVVYLGLFGILLLSVKVVWPAIYQNTEQLILELPYYYTRAIGLLEEYHIVTEGELLHRLKTTLETVFSMESMSRYFGYLSGFASSVVGIFTGIVVSVYMLLEREGLISVLKRMIRLIVKESRQNLVISYFTKAGNLFYSYFAGLGLDAVCIGLISVPFFYFFGVPYAFLFGAIIGICNLIPFFGPIFAAVLIFILSFLSVGPVKALWILVFQIILGQLDSHIIQPKIISHSVGITPFWVVFAVLVFGELWGVLGMIIGVPLVAVARFLMVELEEAKAGDIKKAM
ncbi:MAG: AI-2E family transporter [Clostridia bacterium]|nr:AI-2E family transporter [Clostridia bacterium]